MGKTTCQTNDPGTGPNLLYRVTILFERDRAGPPPVSYKKPKGRRFPWRYLESRLESSAQHYAPEMNRFCEEVFPIFDELEKRNKALNAYQYMLKLSSSTVGKIMLGKDFQHSTSVDAPLNRIVLAIAEVLAINKRIAIRSEWSSHLRFGDPKRLKNLQQLHHG
jgi:hypothetical protein